MNKEGKKVSRKEIEEMVETKIELWQIVYRKLEGDNNRTSYCGKEMVRDVYQEMCRELDNKNIKLVEEGCIDGD